MSNKHAKGKIPKAVDSSCFEQKPHARLSCGIKQKEDRKQNHRQTFTSSAVCVVFITDNNVVSGGFCETQKNKLMCISYTFSCWNANKYLLCYSWWKQGTRWRCVSRLKQIERKCFISITLVASHTVQRG